MGIKHLRSVIWGLVAFVVSTQLFIGLAVDADPCTTYISFPHLEKRDVNFTIPTTETPLSDRFIESGNNWFGEEGYDVALSPPVANQRRCGTTFPMWIKDELPDEGEKTVEACLVDVGDDCFMSVQVQVQACDHLNVYKLTNAPIFEAAYCVGLADPSKPPSSYTVKPDVYIDIVTDDSGTISVDHYEFKCIFTKSPLTLLYSIQWFVNGGFITSFPPAAWTPQISNNAALTETILKQRGYKSPGFDLQCTVRSSIDVGYPAGKGILSDKKFIGIRLPTTLISVQEGEEAKIGLELSAPFGCAGRSYCRLDVHALAIDAPGSCDPSAFILSKCGVNFGANWNETRMMTIKGDVTASVNAKETTMKLFMSTAELVITHPYWSNYLIGSLSVRVTRLQATVSHTYCSAISDPNMKTYDGMYYLFQGFDGSFVLYKHNTLEIEVQMKVKSCRTGSVARCTCGVAVRAGRTVFRIDSCDGDPVKIGFADCSDGNDLLKVLVKGTSYKIYLPTGSRVDVTLNFWDFFNIKLYPSTEDWEMVTGLCGTFNANKTDEDVGADMYTEWRADIDLFNDNHFPGLRRWNLTFGLCECTVQEAWPDDLESIVTCSRTSPRLCTFDKRFTQRSHRECFIQTERRKRSVLHARVDRYRRDVPASEARTWTTEEATIFCEDFFNKSKAAVLCANIPGMASILDENRDNCVSDILAIGGTMFALQALEAAKSLCMNEVELNSTLQEEPAPGVPSIHEALLEVTCENECSGRGSCVKGSCECEEGFASSDCSRDISVPPLIFGMDWDGHCDVATDICNETALIGDYFDEFGQIRCRFTPFTIFSDDSLTKELAQESAPMVESFSEAICIHPTSRQKRSATPTMPTDSVIASGYKISIANYGDVFSEESTLVLYNSQCQACSVNGHLVTCTFTSKSCIVGSQCIQHGETHPENPCFTCDASMPARTWLRKTDSPCTSQEEEFKLWIIGAVVGGLVLAAAVIGLTIFIVNKKKPRKVGDTPRGSAFLHVK